MKPIHTYPLTAKQFNNGKRIAGPFYHKHKKPTGDIVIDNYTRRQVHIIREEYDELKSVITSRDINFILDRADALGDTETADSIFMRFYDLACREDEPKSEKLPDISAYELDRLIDEMSKKAK